MGVWSPGGQHQSDGSPAGISTGASLPGCHGYAHKCRRGKILPPIEGVNDGASRRVVVRAKCQEGKGFLLISQIRASPPDRSRK